MDEKQNCLNKCMVCGDKAIGTNFSVKTCESCKVFFRRNALNFEKFECPFDKNCKIDVLRRKFCKKCRLNKCMTVGMKREWIMTEEERRARRLKIEENKRKKSITQIARCDSTTSPFQYIDPESNSSINDSVDRFRNFSSNSNQINEKIRETPEISNYVYLRAVELELSNNQVVRPLNDFHINFNEIEFNRIMELRRAVKNAIEMPFKKITNEYQKQVINAFQNNKVNGEDVEKLMAIYLEQMLQKTIVFGKGLTSFNSLCENDQIALIKYGCFQVCSVRSVRYFNFEDQYWTLVVDSENSFIFKLDLLRNHGRNTYLDHKNFLTKIGSEWESDDFIIDMLTAIIIFNPDRPTIEHKEMIKFQQQVYMYLLQRYLFLKYKSECESKTKFLRLMNSLTDLYSLDNKIASNWSQIDPQRSMPLMSEICDRYSALNI